MARGVRLICKAPYVRKIWPSWLTGIPEEPLDIPQELLPYSLEFTAFLLDWLRDRGAVQYSTTDSGVFRVLISEADLKGGITQEVININMRTMAYEKPLAQFINSHVDNDVRHIFSDIQALISTACTQFPESLINLIINKAYAGLEVIPTPEADYTWAEVHAMCPFLWVYIYLQTILYRYGNLRSAAR